MTKHRITLTADERAELLGKVQKGKANAITALKRTAWARWCCRVWRSARLRNRSATFASLSRCAVRKGLS